MFLKYGNTGSEDTSYPALIRVDAAMTAVAEALAIFIGSVENIGNITIHETDPVACDAKFFEANKGNDTTRTEKSNEIDASGCRLKYTFILLWSIL